MGVSDFLPAGYGDKQAARILTVDPAKRRVECALRDGAAVYAAVWEMPVIFRWPKTGEIWTIRKDSGIWRLDGLLQDTSKFDNAPLTDLQEGHARIQAETLWNDKGDRFVGLAEHTVAVEATTAVSRGLCDGRLTLASGDPVPVADQTDKDILYFTPYNGNQVGMYDGSSWHAATLSEIAFPITGLAADTVHDVFLDLTTTTETVPGGLRADWYYGADNSPPPDGTAAFAGPLLGSTIIGPVDQLNATAPNNGSTDYWSLRLQGYVRPEFSQTYTFYARTDDGVRVWVNGTQLINSWMAQGATTYSNTIALSAGVDYEIRIEHDQGAGGERLLLEWQSASQARQTIPASRLLTSSEEESLTLNLSAWTDDITRATALTRQDGIYVKSDDKTQRYVGTIRTTGPPTVVQDEARRRYVWNFYNRKMRSLRSPDPVPNLGTYYEQLVTSTSWVHAFDSIQYVEIVTGMPEEAVDLSFHASTWSQESNYSGSTSIGEDGLGRCPEATADYFQAGGYNDGIVNYFAPSTARVTKTPALGYHYYEGLAKAYGSDWFYIYSQGWDTSTDDDIVGGLRGTWQC